MTHETIRVHVIDYGRNSLYMRYRDPATGKHVARSTGTTSKKDANRIAAKSEAELQAGRYKAPSKVTWEEFRERFETEKLPGLSRGYRKPMNTAMNRLDRMGITRLSQLNPDFLSRFQASLRKDDVAEATIRSYFKPLHAALAWAQELGMLTDVPKFTMPKGETASKMNGRPIATEEFERMLAATRTMDLQDPENWRRYLTGLWFSGLRLAESLRLSCEEGDPFAVDLTGKHPHFRITAAAQKSRRNEILPMTPDFAEWLLATPDYEQRGCVFEMTGSRGALLDADGVGDVVTKISEKAGVVVDKATGKYASAHDLRRSFGTRWSKRVKPVILQKLMRHRNIKTTMGFYVQHDADDIAAELWAAHQKGNTLGKTHDETAVFQAE